MTTDELKVFFKEYLTEALKIPLAEMTAENKEFIETMKTQIEQLSKPAVDPKTPGAETLDPKGGFVNFADYATAVFKDEVFRGQPAKQDKRLMVYQEKAAGEGLEEGTDSEGGFLIPEEFRAELLTMAVEKSELMARCMQIPMAVNTIGIPYIKDTTRATGTIHGGVRLYWVDEEGTKTKSKPSFGKITMVLHKLAGLCYASDEILQDSPITLQPLLTNAFTDAFAWTMDGVLLNGTGGAQPLGVLVAPAVISITKETGQAADTIMFENIIKMYARMPARNKANAVWLANEDTFPQLASMSYPVGTSGIPVWLPAGGVSGKPYDTLMGKPLLRCEHCPKLGDAGDISFLDWSQYLLGQKRGAGAGIQTASSMHFKFDTDEMAFRFVFRVDGQPWWPSEMTPRKSDSTISPYIKIAAR